MVSQHCSACCVIHHSSHQIQRNIRSKKKTSNREKNFQADARVWSSDRDLTGKTTIALIWFHYCCNCRNTAGSADTESQSILSKTQNYLQEKRKRSQSQPPVDKKEKITKIKFDFLSTSNFNKIPASKNNINAVTPSNKDTLDSSKKTANPKENIQRRPKLRTSKESEKSSQLITHNLCNFQKFEFTLKNHRQFVQTLVWILNYVSYNH